MPKSFLERLKDPRIRNLLVLGVILLIIIIILLYFWLKKPPAPEAEETKTSQLPQIQSVPGGATSEKYQQLLEEENRKRAALAAKTGTSAVPTIIGAQSKDFASRETFGIEQECKCPTGDGIPGLDPEKAAKLMAELEANPDRAAYLLKQNPGLARALCKQRPDLALKIAQRDHEAAKIIIKECPEFLKILAEKDPALLKKLALEDPEIANQIKDMMKSDSAFADLMGKNNPDLVKQLMKNDPDFAAAMLKNNPKMVKDLMLNDPDFARAMAQAHPDEVKALMDGDPAFAKALLDKTPGLSGILERQLGAGLSTDQQRLQAFEAARKREQDAALDAQKQAQLSELQQKQLQTILAAMDAQSKAIYTSWNEVTVQQFTQGEFRSKQAEMEKAGRGGGSGGASGSGGGRDGSSGKGVLIKAGTIIFAILDTAVNSDEPGPVLATIVEGPYKGAKVLGTMTATAIGGGNFPPERVTLNFTSIAMPDKDKSMSIQAVAIDPDTARTALASDVDHHYLFRYGALFASSFVSGLGQAITSQGSTTTTANNGLSTSTTNPILSSKQQLLAALGNVGTQWGQAVSGLVNLPYTVTVNSGISIGILFLSDVTDS